MKKLLLALASAAALAAFSGCVTRGTQAKLDSINETRKAIDRNTTAVLAGATGIVTESTKPIEDAAVKINEGVAASDAKFDELHKQLEAQQLEFKTFVNGALAAVGEIATELVPGGTAAAKVVGIINKRVTDNAAAAADAKKASEAAQKAAAEVAKEAEKMVATLKAEFVSKEELRKKELELAKQEISALSAKDQVDLKQQLIAEAKARGIKDAEGMTLEQLLAALGASGVSVAALVRTFGRSRSQNEIDQLWDKISELRTMIAEKCGRSRRGSEEA